MPKTTRQTSSELLEYWYRAKNSAFGVVVRSDDRARTIQQLYKVRKEVMDPDLNGLSLVQSPTDLQEIWIIKKGESGGPPEEL